LTFPFSISAVDFANRPKKKAMAVPINKTPEKLTVLYLSK